MKKAKIVVKRKSMENSSIREILRSKTEGMERKSVTEKDMKLVSSNA